jgi:hypothetical protein
MNRQDEKRIAECVRDALMEITTDTTLNLSQRTHQLYGCRRMAHALARDLHGSDMRQPGYRAFVHRAGLDLGM